MLVFGCFELSIGTFKKGNKEGVRDRSPYLMHVSAWKPGEVWRAIVKLRK
jgi:hypothetical protein